MKRQCQIFRTSVSTRSMRMRGVPSSLVLCFWWVVVLPNSRMSNAIISAFIVPTPKTNHATLIIRPATNQHEFISTILSTSTTRPNHSNHMRPSDWQGVRALFSQSPSPRRRMIVDKPTKCEAAAAAASRRRREEKPFFLASSNHTKGFRNKWTVWACSIWICLAIVAGPALSSSSYAAEPTVVSPESDFLTRQEQALSSTTPTPTTTTLLPENGVSNNNGKSRRYWDVMENGSSLEEVRSTNEKLLDYAVGTINTMYYDNSGGILFSPKDMYAKWRYLRAFAQEGPDGIHSLRTKGATLQERTTLQHWWKDHSSPSNNNNNNNNNMPAHAFDTRENAVQSLHWLMGMLNDPFSNYLTREELRGELDTRNDGFLGLGAMVEPPQARSAIAMQQQLLLSSSLFPYQNNKNPMSSQMTKPATTTTTLPLSSISKNNVRIKHPQQQSQILGNAQALHLPIVTAVQPDSPAERAGIVVGDRIVSIGTDPFLHLSPTQVAHKLETRYHAENYAGTPSLRIAKPIVRTTTPSVWNNNDDDHDTTATTSSIMGTANNNKLKPQLMPKETIIGYKTSRIRLTTTSLTPFRPYSRPDTTTATITNIKNPMMPVSQTTLGGTNAMGVSRNMMLPIGNSRNDAAKSPFAADPIVSGGDAIVHYEMLTPSDTIFEMSSDWPLPSGGKVGYIRMTRFSRASTAGYLKAVQELEAAGAQSYIIDVRNNYGGIIQESMLTASTLLRDPHTVLCYTMNSRGGFTPHDAEEYIVDKRYPGYLLSREPPSVTRDQVRRDDPEYLNDGSAWVPPSSFASLHEQGVKRGIHKYVSLDNNNNNNNIRPNLAPSQLRQLKAQKKLVILVNEGTASSAEVFASALRDNGRTVALVGAKTYGKGLIQHTFPMPDGGGLRLTVAEYLTPALQHVTNVGGARYNANGEFVGGGIQPDVLCPSNQGIPGNVGADLCVGMALDALEDAEAKEDEQQQQQQVNVGMSFVNPNVLLFLLGFIRRPGKSYDIFQVYIFTHVTSFYDFELSHLYSIFLRARFTV
eukprot:scaffold75920_cov54-Attheya_sp.AAC.3